MGSQAILGSFGEDELPVEATMSVEVDVLPIADSNTVTASANPTVHEALRHNRQHQLSTKVETQPSTKLRDINVYEGPRLHSCCGVRYV